MVTPIVSSKYRHLYQFCYVKVYSTNRNENLLLLDDPGRVRSQITIEGPMEYTGTIFMMVILSPGNILNFVDF